MTRPRLVLKIEEQVGPSSDRTITVRKYKIPDHASIEILDAILENFNKKVRERFRLPARRK